MNNVRQDPNLSRQFDESFVKTLYDTLRELLDAVNQAANGQLWRHVEKTASYTSGANDHIVIVKPTGTMVVTLPTAESMVGKRVVVKRGNNTTHTVTIQTAAGNIDGSASVTLTTAYQRREFFSDGTQYWEIT